MAGSSSGNHGRPSGPYLRLNTPWTALLGEELWFSGTAGELGLGCVCVCGGWFQEKQSGAWSWPGQSLMVGSLLGLSDPGGQVVCLGTYLPRLQEAGLSRRGQEPLSSPLPQRWSPPFPPLSQALPLPVAHPQFRPPEPG